MKANEGDKRFKKLKKSIKHFIKDENGFVSKENMLKIGLGTISALGIISALSNSFAAHSNTHANHTSHSSSGTTVNLNTVTTEWVAGTSCYRIAAQHTSHASHSSTATHSNSHGNHSSY